VIRELQNYKGYWQIVLGRPVHLEFRDGHIEVLARAPGSDIVFVVDRYAIKTFDFDAFDDEVLQKKKEAWQKIRRIEGALSILDDKEREVLFWRYINHDFEPATITQEVNEGLLYKTLSYSEIADKMRMRRQRVHECAKIAIEKVCQALQNDAVGVYVRA